MFQNKSFLEAVKSIKFSLDNDRHVIISGNDGTGKTQLALWFAEWFVKEKQIENSNIFYCLCTDELKCPDLIGRQSPTNDTAPGKELIEWKNGFLSTAIENGGVVVLDALDQASATVTERLNGLLDQKYDDTEKAKFDVPENPQKPEIFIHKNFRLICSCDINKINQMSPAFVNRFDVIVLENQIESLNEEKKKELIKFLLINSYQENKIKEIIKKEEKEIEKNEINPVFHGIVYTNTINNNEEENIGQIEQNQNEEAGNNDFNFGDEGGNNDFNFDEEGGNNDFNFGDEGGNNDFNFGDEGGNNDFNFNEEGGNNNLNIQGYTGQIVENENLTKIGENVGNNNNESNNKNELDNVNNDINNKEKGQLNDQAQNDNKEINNNQNEENEEIIEENYNPNNDLIDRIYSKSDSFKNIYKLNQFCRTIRIFIIYFKDKNEISEESIVNFCYNILTKDFEKGKLIEIDPKIETILLDLNEEPPSDDPKYFYKNSRMLRNYIAVLHACKIANIHLCVYGPPGAGKTSGTRAFGRIISKEPDKRFDFEMHSFHAGTKPSHYYGTTTLKEGKIYYKNGTLTNSLINGYLFIADELNLSSISNINALAPALEMNLNHKIYFSWN